MPDRPRRKTRRPAPASRPWLPVVIVLAVGGVALGLVGFVVVRTLKQLPELKLDDATNPTAGAKAPAEPAAPALTPRARVTTSLLKVGNMSLSADGGRLLVGTGHGVPGFQTEVWDLNPPRKLREFEAHAAHLSTDGRRLLAPQKVIRLELIDLDTGAVTPAPRQLPGSPVGFFDPHVVVVANWSKDGKVAVNRVDTRTWAAVGPAFVAPASPVGPMYTLSADRRRLVVFESDPPQLSVWDVTTGNRVGGVPVSERDRDGRPGLYVPTPDGARVAVEKGKTLRPALFDAATGREVSDEVWKGMLFKFVPGRELVLGHTPRSGGPDSPPGWHAYLPGRREVVARLPGANYQAALSADGRVFATAAEPIGRDVLIWDVSQLP